MITKTPLATDVGGVLKRHKRDKDDTEVRWMPGSKWALSKLSKRRTLYIISHVTPDQKENLKSILRSSFVPRYIPEERWFFVYNRMDKIRVMEREGIPTLIDDRADIIQWVRDAGMCGIQFGTEGFEDWEMVVREILQNRECCTYDSLDQ